MRANIQIGTCEKGEASIAVWASIPIKQKQCLGIRDILDVGAVGAMSALALRTGPHFLS